jgi:hypothetical protein
MALGTALAIAGLASTAVSTGMSFAQAGKQNALAKQAKQDADMAMEKARQSLEVNVFEGQGIQKEPYELEREALLSAGAQAIEAGVESERGAAATAGRVMMAQNEAQAGQRTAMGQELMALENKQLTEESRLRDANLKLDLGEIEGAQLAARDAEQARTAATQQGFQGVTSLAGQSLSMIPLFSQNIDAQKAAFGNMQMNPEDFQKIGNIGGKTMGAAGTGGFTNLDFDKIKNMSNAEFRQFKKDLTPEQQLMLFRNPQYIKNYNPNPFQF